MIMTPGLRKKSQRLWTALTLAGLCIGLLLPLVHGLAQGLDPQRPVLMLIEAEAPVLAPATGRTRVIVRLIGAGGAPAPGVSVAFVGQGGTVSPAGATTNSQGVAETRFLAGQSAGVAIVQATAGSLSEQALLEITAPLKADGQRRIEIAPAGMALAADRPTEVSFTLRNAVGQPVAGEVITLFASAGSLKPSSAVSDSEGRVLARFEPTGAQGEVRLTALADAATASLKLMLGGAAEVDRAALWLDPPLPRAGRPTAIGLIVSRSAGLAATTTLRVRFFSGEAGAETPIGEGVVPPLSPRGQGSSTAVVWTPQAEGAVRLSAEIVPEGLPPDIAPVAVSRTVGVLPAVVEDPTLPRVTATAIEAADVTLLIRIRAAQGHAPAPAAIFVAEHVYRPELGAWALVRTSGWRPYSGEKVDLPWPASSGERRHLQIWARSRSGDSNAEPFELALFAPPSAEPPLAPPNWRWVELPPVATPDALYLPMVTR